jgi:BirA family biotin operon repressor/biotin-[acetyl-CoA-carboxylase] ligase
MFNLTALEAALAGTVFAGKLHFFPMTDSTNADALAAARNGAPHGSVWFADEQRAGRGRGDHAWHSPAGEGLYASILLRPSISAVRLPLLPLAAGLAAADAIRAVCGLTVDLRWPNDLLVSTARSESDPWAPPPATPQSGQRKLGGILAEAKTEGSSVAYAVVGIGINVHQRRFAEELQPEQQPPTDGAPGFSTPATSLDLETGVPGDSESLANGSAAMEWRDRHSQRGRQAEHPVSRQALLVSLLKSLEREALGLADPAAGERIIWRVESASTWVRNRRVEVHGPQACTGITAGLDEHGFLLVRTATGLVTVHTGGIRDAAIP